MAAPPPPASSPRSGARATSRKVGSGIVAFWRVLRANPLTLIGFLVVVVIGVTAVVMVTAPHLLTRYGADQLTTDYNQGPSWQHPGGTDGIGLDIFSETLYALPLDLAIAFAIAGTAMIAGGDLGTRRRVLGPAGNGRRLGLRGRPAHHGHLPGVSEPDSGPRRSRSPSDGGSGS